MSLHEPELTIQNMSYYKSVIYTLKFRGWMEVRFGCAGQCKVLDAVFELVINEKVLAVLPACHTDKY